MRRLLRNPRIAISGGYLLILVVAALFANYLAPHDPSQINPDLFLRPPSADHWLGNDELGRDLLTRLLYGARTSLTVTAGAVGVAGALGVLIGCMAGLLGGYVETLIMRAMDMMLILPALLLAIATAAFVGKGVGPMIGILGFVYLPRFARIAHSSVLSIRQAEYVQASRAAGAPMFYLLRRTLLPNIAAPLIIQASLALGFAMRAEASLSFLGLGPPPPLATWGRMIDASRRYMNSAEHLVIFPSLVLAVTLLALNVLGDGLRDALDPKLRGKN